MKKAVVLGGGGFIGGHLAKRLKREGYKVRIADIKRHEYFTEEEICHEYIVADLRDPQAVSLVIDENSELVFQLAADMGGAGYIFTGLNDANVMHNSALINLNVAKECVDKKIKRVFYSSSACMYPEHNQLDPENPNCEESSAYPANPDSEYVRLKNDALRELELEPIKPLKHWQGSLRYLRRASNQLVKSIRPVTVR